MERLVSVRARIQDETRKEHEKTEKYQGLKEQLGQMSKFKSKMVIKKH